MGNNTTTPESEVIQLGVKKSKNCVHGDILLETGGGYYASPLGGEKHSKFYLLRKIDDEWKVIEYLGESSWIS